MGKKILNIFDKRIFAIKSLIIKNLIWPEYISDKVNKYMTDYIGIALLYIYYKISKA